MLKLVGDFWREELMCPPRQLGSVSPPPLGPDRGEPSGQGGNGFGLERESSRSKVRLSSSAGERPSLSSGALTVERSQIIFGVVFWVPIMDHQFNQYEYY